MGMEFEQVMERITLKALVDIALNGITFRLFAA